MGYNFYGWQKADVKAVNSLYEGIETPRELYDALSDIWCADTCAPRMRSRWSRENKTMGQCSITAFLAQDIFGGRVYGILRPDGNYHCYNVVGGCVFDLTSEQFGDEVLVYENNPEQFRDIHFAGEEKRLRYEYLKKQLRDSRKLKNGGTKEAMGETIKNGKDYRKKLAELLLTDALYTYTFDVTTGVIEDDIVSSVGINYTDVYGLTSPCSFDEIIRRSFSRKYLPVEYTLDSSVKELSCAELLMAYEAGKRRIEAKIYLADTRRYNRITYMIDHDEETDHVLCYVIGQDITGMENQWIRENDSAQKELADTDNVLNCAGIGIWHIFMFDNEKPCMKGNKMMYELLGVEPAEMSPEETYDFWYSRIKKSSLPSVEASVAEMIEKGISENTYVWNHPKRGDISVRCGGTAQYVEGKGYILRGYHSDVTDIINSDIKQKQLLADALEETKKQKTLLQEALDNYKQADYDRRRDFLTGLRNRQDLYDLLQDTLSVKRDSIKAMFMMDIDNFKMLNDNYGHTMGDECLVKIGQALRKYGEENDMYFFRYGGEEILGISFDNDKPEDLVADELVKLIYNLGIKRDDVKTGVVTISLGYTTDNSQHEKMIDKADTAMYHAKSKGKNQYMCYENM